MRFMLCALLIAAPAIATAADTVIEFSDGSGGRDGTGGFSVNNPALKFGVTSDKSFDGKSKSLQVSGSAEYVGAVLQKKITDHDTRIVLVYWAEGFNGNLVVQGGSAGLKKNAHALVAPVVSGHWAVSEVKLATFCDWNGKTVPPGDSLDSLLIYGTPADVKKGATLYLSRVAIVEGEDRMPPEAPANPAATVKDHAVEVSWDPAKDNVLTARYEVYRGMKPDFAARADNRVGEVTTVTFRDDTLSNFGTYYYRILPIDAAGNRGTLSAAARIAVEND